VQLLGLGSLLLTSNAPPSAPRDHPSRAASEDTGKTALAWYHKGSGVRGGILSFDLKVMIRYMAKESIYNWAPVAHVCNPSYSGGRDQEDHGSKPAWVNSSMRPYLKKKKKKITKKDW
jgi:hypothetical protein